MSLSNLTKTALETDGQVFGTYKGWEFLAEQSTPNGRIWVTIFMLTGISECDQGVNLIRAYDYKVSDVKDFIRDEVNSCQYDAKTVRRLSIKHGGSHTLDELINLEGL